MNIPGPPVIVIEVRVLFRWQEIVSKLFSERRSQPEVIDTWRYTTIPAIEKCCKFKFLHISRIDPSVILQPFLISILTNQIPAKLSCRSVLEHFPLAIAFTAVSSILLTIPLCN